jgi:hypothetical protein
MYPTSLLSRHASIQSLLLAALGLFLAAASGCSLRWDVVDPRLAGEARLFLQQNDRDLDWPPADEYEPREPMREGTFGEILVGELIAIFPGLIVPGLGHYYAGDYRTSAQLRRVGQFGQLLTAIGGGLLYGGYALDRNDQKTFAYSLYGTGGTIGILGLFFYMTAYVYDVIDTPRAVRSGGRPPPRSDFVDSLDIFSD